LMMHAWTRWPCPWSRGRIAGRCRFDCDCLLPCLLVGPCRIAELSGWLWPAGELPVVSPGGLRVVSCLVGSTTRPSRLCDCAAVCVCSLACLLALVLCLRWVSGNSRRYKASSALPT
jgi:hypothetical protein